MDSARHTPCVLQDEAGLPFGSHGPARTLTTWLMTMRVDFLLTPRVHQGSSWSQTLRRWLRGLKADGWSSWCIWAAAGHQGKGKEMWRLHLGS